MTIALDGEDYHSALLGYREARALLKEVRVARGFYPVVVPVRPDKPKGKGKSESPDKIGSGKAGKGFKCAGRSSDSAGRGRTGRGKGHLGSVRDVQIEFTKCVSNSVRLITGHVTVREWMTNLAVQRSETSVPTPMVRGFAAILCRL